MKLCPKCGALLRDDWCASCLETVQPQQPSRRSFFMELGALFVAGATARILPAQRPLLTGAIGAASWGPPNIPSTLEAQLLRAQYFQARYLDQAMSLKTYVDFSKVADSDFTKAQG